MSANGLASHDDDSEPLKYLHAVMNSSLIQWRLQHSSLPIDARAIELAPIPRITDHEQRPFIRLVDQILGAKAADPDADTWMLETEIDDLVYDLYGLNEEEITTIERGMGLIHQP